MVQQVQEEVVNPYLEESVWRNIIPVNPPMWGGVPRLAHSVKYYELKDVSPGKFFYIKQNAEVEEAVETGYEPVTRDYIGLVRKWKIHNNDIEVSDGRIRADTILKTIETMEKEIEGLFLGVAEVNGASVNGLQAFTGINTGTAGNGNGMTEIYDLVNELDNKLVEDHFKDYTKRRFIFDATIKGYLTKLHGTMAVTAKEKLIANGIFTPAQMHLTSNLTPDTGDAAMIYVQSDPANFYVKEPTNGIRAKVYGGGFLQPDHHFHGYLEWAGVLCVPRAKSIAANTGVASA